VYGRWFPKGVLTIGQCAAASLLLIALMYGLTRLEIPARVRGWMRRPQPERLAESAWPH
jgi:hypothetical protein